MNFSLSDEQRMLDDTLTRLIRERLDAGSRRALINEAGTEPSVLWQTFGELGLLAMPFAEEAGGLGGDGTDLLLIMQALGRGLVPEPYVDGLLLPGSLLARLGTAAQHERWLAPLLEGQHQLAFAWHEPGNRYDVSQADDTVARRNGDGWHLQGTKRVVINAPRAAALLITARLEDASLGLFLVPSDTRGIHRCSYTTIDGQSAADLELTGLDLPAEALLSHGEALREALDASLALARAALCAEAVGAMQSACDQTLAYLKERRQFGAPLSRQQSLQHRMVDMTLELEQARSMAILACHSLEMPAHQRNTRVAAAKAYCGEAARFVAEQAIQLHGGMGMTEECEVSHFAKRLVMLDHCLGDADHHLDTVGAHLIDAA
jgi:alkylation response protein AidB-like acyl-CoA dehydrogenase